MLRHDSSDVQFKTNYASQVQPTLLRLLGQDRVTKTDWTSLFMSVYNICNWDETCHKEFYETLHTEITRFIHQAAQRVREHEGESALLRAYCQEWQRFFDQCAYLPQPFHHLESLLKSNSNCAASSSSQTNPESIIRNLMLSCWNESIFQDVKQRLQEGAMHLVDLERQGKSFDSQLVIGVRESFVNLDVSANQRLKVYTENFQLAYLEATEQFYGPKAGAYLASEGVHQYMVWAEAKLNEEMERAIRYLETRYGCVSVEKLEKCCVKVLVEDYKDAMLAECPALIKANNTEQLHLMYKLMDKIEGGVLPMLHDLQTHIKESGAANMHACAATIISDSEQYVEMLLDLFKKFTELITNAFAMDSRFLTARDMAYKHLVNDASIFKIELPTRVRAPQKGQPESKCPELLANYCDMLLRKTPLSKKLSADEVEQRLKSLILVLKYVQNKDVFMRFYKTHLTRRLILSTSVDSEVEEIMVDWLRDIGMPADYINSMSRMFQDVKVSDGLNTEFREMVRNNNESLADVHIKILNAGAWLRSSEKMPVSLPSELEDVISLTEDFYRSKQNGRVLTWNNLMSNGTLTFANECGKYELEVTTFQMAILCAWNDRSGEQLSLESLRLATQLPDSELKRTLWSLVAMPKLKKQVLTYQPTVSSHKDFTDTTLFAVNQQFCLIKSGKVQKRGRVNLIGRLQLSTEKSSQEDSEAIVQLRVLRVQEAIVQLMKMRKCLSNAALQMELVQMLRNMFLPSKKLIKEQLEWLIDNRYIRRDENDINMFIYMA